MTQRKGVFVAVLSMALITLAYSQTNPSPADKQGQRKTLAPGIYSAIVLTNKSEKPTHVQIQGADQGDVIVSPNSTLVIPFAPAWHPAGPVGLYIVTPLGSSWETDMFGWGATPDGPKSR